jgi:hypothetical protein
MAGGFLEHGTGIVGGDVLGHDAGRVGGGVHVPGAVEGGRRRPCSRGCEGSAAAAVFHMLPRFGGVSAWRRRRTRLGVRRAGDWENSVFDYRVGDLD